MQTVFLPSARVRLTRAKPMHVPMHFARRNSPLPENKHPGLLKQLAGEE